MKESSPTHMCILMILYFTAYTFQYYIFCLYLTKLGGNKFVNSVIFGGAESLTVIFSGILMSLISDITVFRMIFMTCLLSYAVFIFAPDAN